MGNKTVSGAGRPSVLCKIADPEYISLDMVLIRYIYDMTVLYHQFAIAFFVIGVSLNMFPFFKVFFFRNKNIRCTSHFQRHP